MGMAVSKESQVTTDTPTAEAAYASWKATLSPEDLERFNDLAIAGVPLLFDVLKAQLNDLMAAKGLSLLEAIPDGMIDGASASTLKMLEPSE